MQPCVPELASSATLVIGNTAAVKLDRFVKAAGLDGSILAKLEFLNPGGSKKDRVAAQMIVDAEEARQLQPGQTVIELTSGNTGTGLAIVCATRGYKFVAVMSAGNSPERVSMMRAFGAEVVIVRQSSEGRAGFVSGEDLALVEAEASRLVSERLGFRADQFRLNSNFRAHYLGTGPEMVEQAKGNIDAFCDFVGSGGTFGGCAAALKEACPRVRCYIVESQGAEVLAGKPVLQDRHPIQGGGYGIRSLPNLHPELADGYLSVSGIDARHASRLLAHTEGLFAGYSSGANLAAACQLLRGPHRGGTVAITLNDSGLKYLSTDLWSESSSQQEDEPRGLGL